MTVVQKLRARIIIAWVARQNGISTSQCRSEIERAISAAWTTADPEVKQRQNWLAGEGRVPSPEEFIVLLSNQDR